MMKNKIGIEWRADVGGIVEGVRAEHKSPERWRRLRVRTHERKVRATGEMDGGLP